MKHTFCAAYSAIQRKNHTDPKPPEGCLGAGSGSFLTNSNKICRPQTNYNKCLSANICIWGAKGENLKANSIPNNIHAFFKNREIDPTKNSKLLDFSFSKNQTKEKTIRNRWLAAHSLKSDEKNVWERFSLLVS